MHTLARHATALSPLPAPFAEFPQDFLDPSPSPFPISALPTLLRDFSAAAELSLGLPAVAFALPMLAVAGATIGNSRRAILSDDDHAPALLWTALVSPGDTSAASAIRLALAPLLDRTAELAEAFQDDQKAHLTNLRQWPAASPNPPGSRPTSRSTDYPHLYLDNVSPPTISLRLSRQPRGLILAPRDLSPWLANSDPAFLQYFDAAPCRFDRPGVQPLARFIPQAFLAITGSILAQTLQNLLDTPNFDSPIPSRFLFAQLPPHRPRPSNISIPSHLKSEWARAIMQLMTIPLWTGSKIDTRSGPDTAPIPIAPSARSLWLPAHDRLCARIDAHADFRLRRHLTNLLAYIPRLALVLQLLSWAAEESTDDGIDDQAMTGAIQLIDWFFDQTPNLYNTPEPDQDAQEIYSIIDLIRTHGNQITVRQLMRSRSCFPNSSEAASFLRALASEGLGEMTWLPTTGCGKPKLVFRLATDTDNIPPGAIKNGNIVSAPSPKPP